MKKANLLILAAFLCCHAMLFSQEPVHLWADASGKSKRVTLTPYLPPEGERRAAVVVCPGGSYSWLALKTEGEDVARWLQANGVAAFVLKYRVQGVSAFIHHTRLFVRGNRHPDQLQDAGKALDYLREHADDYGIDPTRLGIMGFSAGGHLAMLTAEMLPQDKRPAFVAAIYPVVSMSQRCTHKRSRRALLGEYGKRSRLMRDSLSVEKHVPADCPPVFLVNCEDDPTVKWQNSALLDSALSAKRVPHKYIRYRTGGHGFGASSTKGTSESRAWKGEFLCWMKSLGL